LAGVLPALEAPTDTFPAKQNAAGHIQELLDQAGGASMKDCRASPLR
jgi:hypothetical protein